MGCPYVAGGDWHIVPAPIQGHEGGGTHGHTWTCVGMAGLHQSRAMAMVAGRERREELAGERREGELGRAAENC